MLKAKEHVASFTSEPLALIQRSDITVAHAFSYQALEATRSKPHLAYVLPKEGAVHWVDTFVISTHSGLKKQAHTFLNYILDPGHAAELQDLNHLPSVVPLERELAAKPSQPAEKVFKEIKPLFFFQDLNPDSLMRMGKAWTEIKTG